MVSSKQTKINFGSNRNKPKQDLFRVCFVKPKKKIFGLFQCFEPLSKQPKQTELFRNEPKQSGIFFLQRIKQKEAIRVINNAGYRDHTQPLFKKNKILPLDSMIKYSNLRFMHSYFHHNLPFSFEQLWIPNRDHKI